MSGFFTLIAENILVILGFALYGILLYYMVVRSIRRYTGKNSRRGSGKSSGHSQPINDQDSSESSVFFTMFTKKSAESEDENTHRKDFSSDITTANSYVHKKSRED